MDGITNDIIKTLQYLLPGFLTAWIFYGLTSFSKPSQFERVIQALIFTLITQTIVLIEKTALIKAGNTHAFGKWTTTSELICSVFTAILLGLIISYYANNDKCHKLVRKIGLSRETSFPSEWFGAFLNNVTYVVLHLNDERRLYGWPIEWPSESDKGHFVLEQASWLIEEENKTKEIEVTGVKAIMINVKDIKWVEFMNMPKEEK